MSGSAFWFPYLARPVLNEDGIKVETLGSDVEVGYMEGLAESCSRDDWVLSEESLALNA